MWKVCKKCNFASPYCQDDSLSCRDCGQIMEVKNLGTCTCKTCDGKGTIEEKPNTITPIIIRRKKVEKEINLLDFLS